MAHAFQIGNPIHFIQIGCFHHTRIGHIQHRHIMMGTRLWHQIVAFFKACCTWFVLRGSADFILVTGQMKDQIIIRLHGFLILR